MLCNVRGLDSDHPRARFPVRRNVVLFGRMLEWEKPRVGRRFLTSLCGFLRKQVAGFENRFGGIREIQDHRSNHEEDYQ